MNGAVSAARSKMVTARPSEIKWLDECKQDIVHSDEWRAVSGQLLASVEQQLRVSGLSQFSEFDEKSKLFAIKTAVNSTENGEAFANLYARLSRSLDYSLARSWGKLREHTVVDRCRNIRPQHATSLSADDGHDDLARHITNECSDAASDILQRWPQVLGTVRLFLNKPLSGALRCTFWQVKHSDGSGNIDPLCTASRQSQYGHLHSVSSSANNPDLMSLVRGKLSKTVYGGMALWKEHDQRGISSLLGAIEYCNTYKQLPTAAAVALQDTSTDDVVSLLIPFVYAIAMETLPPTNQQHEVQVTAPFIEFHHKRPSPCRSSGQESKSAAGSLARDVLEILQRNYPELHEHIMGVLSGSKQTAGHQASVPAYKYLRDILRPCWNVFWSGILPIEVVCFLLEQLWICEDCQADCSYLATATATWLMLCSTSLLKCRTVGELQHRLHDQSATLTLNEFQTTISHLFLPGLRRALSIAVQKDAATLSHVKHNGPALEPPWIHWSKDHRQRRLIEERKTAHEERLKRHTEGVRRAREERQRHDSEIARALQSTMESRENLETTLQKLRQELKLREGENKELRRANSTLQTLLGSGLQPPHDTQPSAAPHVPSWQHSYYSRQSQDSVMSRDLVSSYGSDEGTLSNTVSSVTRDTAQHPVDNGDGGEEDEEVREEDEEAEHGSAQSEVSLDTVHSTSTRQ